jgi:hypothetical protein
VRRRRHFILYNTDRYYQSESCLGALLVSSTMSKGHAGRTASPVAEGRHRIGDMPPILHVSINQCAFGLATAGRVTHSSSFRRREYRRPSLGMDFSEGVFYHTV